MPLRFVRTIWGRGIGRGKGDEVRFFSPHLTFVSVATIALSFEMDVCELQVDESVDLYRRLSLFSLLSLYS